MVEKALSSWSEFLEKARCLARDHGDRWPPPLFRGLGNSTWTLATTLERAYPLERASENLSFVQYYSRVDAVRGAVETLTGRRWSVPNYFEFEELVNSTPRWLDLLLNSKQEIYELLLYLRHHGFPSPLLDWTASPYIAGLFAFDAVSDRTDRVGVYAFVKSRASANPTSAGQHLITVGPYGRSHPRHHAQQCWYSMCVKPEAGDYLIRRQDEAIAEIAAPDGALVKFTIPVSERIAALKELDLMNVNAYSLFASEDSLIRTVGRREFLFRDRVL